MLGADERGIVPTLTAGAATGCCQLGSMDSQRYLRTGYQAHNSEQLGKDGEAHS